MSLSKKYIGDLFIPLRFYLVAGGCAFLFLIAFFIPVLYTPTRIIFACALLLVLVDYFFLFLFGRPPSVRRVMTDRLSNGDQNPVQIRLQNRMPFPVKVDIIDELPEQLQERNFLLSKKLPARGKESVTYQIRPTERGGYTFGRVLLYVSSALGLVARRFETEAGKEAAVYPSFMHFRKYQLIAQAAQTSETGARKARKIGQSLEFEQIKEYVPGDDVRTLNWKATARKGSLMVNTYTEEKSQQVYCLIDKGRLMKMPFHGLSLLDHAINSTLIMTGVCLQRQDRVGLMTFSDRMGVMVPADRKPVQREKIMQVLYKQQTVFLESDFEMLYMQVRSKIRQRSLLILYTNFESLNGLRRQLPYLRSIARYHLLLVVFFENTELTRLSQAKAEDLEDVYIRTTAEKFHFEKKLIVRELQKYGILSILTSPEKLTVQTVNKYIELKNSRAL